MKVPITWVTLVLVFIVVLSYKYLILSSFTWQGFLSLVCIFLLFCIAVEDAVNTWKGD